MVDQPLPVEREGGVGGTWLWKGDKSLEQASISICYQVVLEVI